MAAPAAEAKPPKADDSSKTGELAKLVRSRAATLVSKMNAAFDKERKAGLTAAKAALTAKLKKEAKDGKVDDKKLKEDIKTLETNFPKFTMSILKSDVSTALRGGGYQGYLAIEGWTSTCGSAHMTRAAIHVTISVKRGGASKTIGMKFADFMPGTYAHSDHVTKTKPVWAILSQATYAKHWTTSLKAAKLADYSGAGVAFQPKDPFHVELPRKAVKGKIEAADVVKGTRPAGSSKARDACIESYSKYAALTEHLKKADKSKLETKFKANYKSKIDAKKKVHKAAIDKRLQALKTSMQKAKLDEKQTAAKEKAFWADLVKEADKHKKQSEKDRQSFDD
ncbi:MAG: hypothetical protein AB8B51_06475 [Sedimentitalea sp.]